MPDISRSIVRRLTGNDAGALLTLQRAAFVSEAQLYRNPFLPALTQTLEELRTELAAPALGAELAGRLVGAVRWAVDGGIAHISRLIVAPDLQGQGLGTTLLRAAEASSGAERFELFTGHLSEANLRLYEREGYVRTHTTVFQPGLELVHLSKGGE